MTQSPITLTYPLLSEKMRYWINKNPDKVSMKRAGMIQGTRNSNGNIEFKGLNPSIYYSGKGDTMYEVGAGYELTFTDPDVATMFKLRF